jgi:hypothetical protein
VRGDHGEVLVVVRGTLRVHDTRHGICPGLRILVTRSRSSTARSLAPSASAVPTAP